ncbi:MAG TPA: trigger factor [Bacteroidales bacterium]|nr:trigger factor [Bacteroidales bacterium]
MKVTKENTGDLTAVLTINISEEDYAQKLDEQLKTHRRKANVPGFRPGQVPMGMIKKMYELPVRADIIEKGMSEAMYEFLDKEKIQIMGYPLANDEKTKIDWETQKEFTFYFDIALQPEFELNLDKIEETYYNIVPSDDMLDKFVEDLQRRFGQFSSPEKVEENDLVYGELSELDKDGNIKEDGALSTTSLSVNMIADKEIQSLFIGKEKDAEVIFDIAKAFPNETDRAAMLKMDKEDAKDLNTNFKFVISSINRIALHELNEELFEKAYKAEGIATLEDFRKRATKDLSETYRRESDRFFTNEATQKIVKGANFELPDEFMKRWLVSNSQEKLTMEQVEAEYEMYRDSLKWQLIETKLLEKFSLEVTKDEVKTYFKEALLGNYFPEGENETEEETKQRLEAMESVSENMMKNQDQTKQVYDYLYDQKLTQTLRDNLKVEEKSVTVDEFTKMVQDQTK